MISDSWVSVAEKILLGLRIDAIRSHSHPARANGRARGAERACRWSLRAANQHRRREGIGGAWGRQRERRDRRLGLIRTFMLGVPFGPRTAHVVQLRPVGVEQGSGQTVQQFADVASSPCFVAASSASENCGRCPDHDGTVWAWSLLHPLVGDRAAGRGSTESQLLELNLRKTSLLRYWRYAVSVGTDVISVTLFANL